MIRRCQMNINYANQAKLNSLDVIFVEASRVINEFINIYWELKDFKSKYSTINVDTWLSARMQQCLGKQALEIVKSQRKKHKKTKPTFNKSTINLDSRFIDIQFDNNSFDTWIRFSSIGNKIILKLPSKKHIHFHKFEDWNLKESVRLRKSNDKFYIDLYFEKEAPALKSKGKDIGLDSGYNKLLISSENKVYDEGLENIYEKISRKKQGSNRFKKALVERDNKINESVNTLKFNELKIVVVEDLKNLKQGSKGKISKKFNNKLQRWSYSKVLNRLALQCEEQGIDYRKVNPAYTSQMCSKCGFIHKDNRNKERFKCLDCNFEADADYNASVNILHRGIYSSTTTKNIK